ncbi:MAG TPA: hypothetical protein VGD40_14035 [Chryseosolibacter sp.]
MNIRITNTSNYDFDSLFVNTGGEQHGYGTIAAGQNSDYHQFVKAYRYAYLEVVVNGEKHIYQPIDYVGEELLNSGNYSFQISVNMAANTYKRVELTLAKD